LMFDRYTKRILLKMEFGPSARTETCNKGMSGLRHQTRPQDLARKLASPAGVLL
jgi:hypothetical protein